VRDIDVLKKMPSMVTLTITTDNDNISEIIEPNAPSSSKRIKTVETLIGKGIPTSVRIDPIIPFVNNNPKGLIETLASIGVTHITSSTYKVKPDNWKRFNMALPKTAKKAETILFRERRKDRQLHLLTKGVEVRIDEKSGLVSQKLWYPIWNMQRRLKPFKHHLNTTTCDGSWLIKQKRRFE